MLFFPTIIYPDKEPVCFYSSDLLLPKLSGGKSKALDFESYQLCTVVCDFQGAWILKP